MGSWPGSPLLLVASAVIGESLPLQLAESRLAGCPAGLVGRVSGPARASAHFGVGVISIGRAGPESNWITTECSSSQWWRACHVGAARADATRYRDRNAGPGEGYST
ncbi:hypothetical protein GCM10009531_45790 [Actinoplanes capillaceus]